MSKGYTQGFDRSGEGELWLEMYAHWLGGVTAARLGRALGIARETAQRRVLGPYREAYGFGYDDVERTSRIAGDAESLKRAPDDPQDVFALLRAERILGERGVHPRAEVSVEDVSLPLPPSNEEAFRSLLAAAASRCAVSLEYQAKSRRMAGRFSPHSLVRTSGRMHFRGWGEFRVDGGMFLDIVPDRVIAVGSPDRNSYRDGSDDAEWNERCVVRAEIAAGVPEAIAAALRQEQPEGVAVRTRKATKRYIEAALLARRVEGFADPVWTLVPF